MDTGNAGAGFCEMASLPTARGEVRERSPSRLNPTSHVRPEDGSDGQERPGRRPRFLPESLATEHEYGTRILWDSMVHVTLCFYCVFFFICFLYNCCNNTF